MWTIREAIGASDISVVRGLFEEYGSSLGVDLAFQGFEEELANMPGAYAPPRGVLLLATLDDQPIGCVGVRPLADDVCEMKRLYVRRAGRGHGIGRALADHVIAFARAAGYRLIRLDTLPGMTEAQAMYRRLGFREVPPYRFNPVPGTTFMQMTLDDER